MGLIKIQTFIKIYNKSVNATCMLIELKKHREVSTVRGTIP